MLGSPSTTATGEVAARAVPLPVLVRVAVGVAVAAGTGLRAWYVVHGPLTADAAGVGLMARGILHGHLRAFLPGEVYGGAEAYVVAPLIAAFGQDAPAVDLAPILLAAVAALLTWRAARRVADRSLAVLAGALVWVAPLSAVMNSTLERGFRGVVLACGLGALLVALRMLGGHRSPWSFGLLGLLLGAGWWASPEIAYFLVPVAGLVAVAARRAPRVRARRTLLDVAALVAGAGAGAAPWLWANAGSGFASLDPHAYMGTQIASTFGSRLGTFFARVLPMQFGLFEPVSGYPHAGEPAVYGFLLAALILAGVLAWRSGAAGRALVAGLVTFPVLYALQPGTWYWYDGRYAVFLVPLMALVVATAASRVATDRASGRPPAAGGRRGAVVRVLGASVLLAATASSVLTLRGDAKWTDPFVTGLTAGWGNPEAPTYRAIDRLERAGVRTGYADYWVAYDLDFLSDGRLAITTAPPDVDVDPAIAAQVRKAPAPAWLFVPGAQPRTGWWQYGQTPAIAGPGGTTEERFLEALGRMGVPYRLVAAGPIEAVVPYRKVTPATLGAGRATSVSRSPSWRTPSRPPLLVGPAVSTAVSVSCRPRAGPGRPASPAPAGPMPGGAPLGFHACPVCAWRWPSWTRSSATSTATSSGSSSRCARRRQPEQTSA